MSLGTHLRDRNSPVNRFIQEQFPNTKTAPFLVDARKQMRASEAIRTPDADALPWSTIGIAMDYRIRYYFDVTPVESLVAYYWDVYIGAPGGAPAYGDLPYLAHDFFHNLENFTNQCQPVARRLPAVEEDVLNRYCIVLALFDEVVRAGLSHNSPLSKERFNDAEDLLTVAETRWLDDMRHLSWRFYDGFSHLLEFPHILNPTFDGSPDVGGADADLIVDGALIDIKTTKNQRIDAYFIRELLGYTLLDYSDRYHIDSIGLYMSRQGILFKWSLDEVFGDLCPGPAPSIAELRGKFQELMDSPGNR